MFHLIISLVVLIASVWLGVELAQHPGYALFVFRQWTVELPLWLVILGLVILLFIMYLLLQIFAFFHHLDANFHAWLVRFRHQRADDKTARGLLFLKEERWSKAERYLLAGIDASKNPVANYLFAAEAAYAQKALDRGDRYLEKAYQAAPQGEVVIGLLQAKMYLERGWHEQVLEILNKIRQLSPYHPGILRLLEKVYIRLSDWQMLLNLLPYLKKAKIVPGDQFLIFEKNIYCELLDEAEHKSLSIHDVRELWQTIPKKIRLYPDILERYTKLLKEDKNSATEIEPLIRQLLRKEWNAELVKLYGSLLTENPAAQLAVAESWVKQYGKRVPLLLTLGRLSLRCQLWGKAKSYLEESLKQDLNSETQYELAKLFEQLGETQLALRHYRNGLALATVDAR